MRHACVHCVRVIQVMLLLWVWSQSGVCLLWEIEWPCQPSSQVLKCISDNPLNFKVSLRGLCESSGLVEINWLQTFKSPKSGSREADQSTWRKPPWGYCLSWAGGCCSQGWKTSTRLALPEMTPLDRQPTWSRLCFEWSSLIWEWCF